MERHLAAGAGAGRGRVSVGRALLLAAGVGSVMAGGAGLATATPSLDAVRLAPTMPSTDLAGQAPSAPSTEDLGSVPNLDQQVPSLSSLSTLDLPGSSVEISGDGYQGGGTVDGKDIAAYGSNSLLSGHGTAGPDGGNLGASADSLNGLG